MRLDHFPFVSETRAGDPAIRSARQVEEADRVTRLREAVVSETQTAALLTAALTSGANGLTDKTVHIGPEDMKAHAPGDLSRLRTLTEMLIESDFSVDEPVFLVEFLAGARVGDDMLASYFNEAEHLGAHRAAVLHRTGLSEAWRQICHLAILALKEVDAYIAPDLPEVYVQNSRVLTALLNGAKSGWRPCVDADGRLHLPPLPQQRRWPRRALLQSCKLRHRNSWVDAFARDVSAGGLGLDHAPPLAPGEPVTAELVCGRVLKGLVAWSKGATAGVRFHAELKPNDPLLMA